MRRGLTGTGVSSTAGTGGFLGSAPPSSTWTRRGLAGVCWDFGDTPPFLLHLGSGLAAANFVSTATMQDGSNGRHHCGLEVREIETETPTSGSHLSRTYENMFEFRLLGQIVLALAENMEKDQAHA